MRKKIAMKLRKDALRRGADLSGEKYVFSKRELRRQGLKASDNGYCLVLRYKGEVIHVKEKLQVLRDFGIVDDDSEEHLRNEMERAIAARPNTHFDRILDRFATDLYRQKLA